MSVLGIDIGTSFCVLGSIQRGAVMIVRNDLSERLTPALVSFTDKERLIGEAAQTQIRSNFRNTARNLKQLLGCTNPHAEDFAKEAQNSLAQLEFVDGFPAYRVRYKGEEKVMNATRCMAALLTKLKEIGEKGTGAPVQDVVISVPGWFSEISRQAMMDAAEIAGLNCLRAMNEHAAIALDYGIYRSNSFDVETASRVAFVGIGHGSANVCVTDYVKGELRIVAVGNDRSLGGRDLDHEIIKHFAQQFEAKHKVNPMTNAKAVLKLEEAANRAKKMVSANLEAPFNIECLVDEFDIHGLLTRQGFEELCQPHSLRLTELLRTTFENSGIRPDSVHHVEIVGGCTRIPWVQETIVQFFNNRLPLSKTLNMDEAVARGCALQAAMLNRRYRVREFTVVDRLFEPVTVSWLVGDEAKTSLLFDSGSILGTKKWLTFQRHTGFEIRLTAGSHSQPLVSFIEPPTDDLDPTLPRKIKLGARLSHNGIASWEVAQLFVDEVEDVVLKESRPVGGDHSMCDVNDSEHQPQTQEGTANATEQKPAEQQQFEEVEVHKKKTRSRRFDCHIHIQPRAGYLTPNMKSEFREAEIAMGTDDRKQQESREMMNSFEAYIYDMRSKLQGQLSEFASSAERTQLADKLVEYENWIYDNPEGSAALYTSKLDELKAFGDPIEARQIERTRLSEAIQELSDTISILRETMMSPDFSHVEPVKLQSLGAKLCDVEKWLTHLAAEVDKTVIYQDVANVKAKDIENESSTLKNFAKTILTAKPAEPKPENAEMSGSHSTTATDSSVSPETTNDVPM